MEELMKCRKLCFGILFILAFTFSVTTFSKKSEACCEQVATAWASITALVTSVMDRIQDWIDQATSFIDLSFLNAQWEIVTRFMEFDQNSRQAFSDFWGNYLPALQEQTQQINTAELAQAEMVGHYMDAELILQDRLLADSRATEGTRRFLASDDSCQMESTKSTQTELEHMTRAVAAAANIEGIQRNGNGVGTIAQNGSKAENRALVAEQRLQFCIVGQYGCAANGALPMQNVMLGTRLRGQDMSKNLNIEAERLANQRVLENFISPKSLPIVSASALTASNAQGQMIYTHRPLEARKSLLRYVAAEQLAESIEGVPNPDVQATRQAAGVNPALVSANPSLREVSEAQRERLLSQVFFEQRVEDPHSLLRQMADLKEQQLRSWVKIKRLRERRLALLSSELGFDIEDNGSAK